MEWMKALLLGIIQGVTEWLPVSSTGHMLLFDALFPLRVSSSCSSLFMVLVQLGSILAVIVLYFSTLNPFSPKKSREEKSETWKLWEKVLVASLPVAAIGLLLDDFVDAHLHTWPVISAALFFYGVLYILIGKGKGRGARVESLEAITMRDALLIGLFQTLAIVPGTSRSGSTILGALILGLDRPTAARFSFFMAIPAMLGASLLKLVKLGFSLTSSEWALVLTSFLVAFLVSLLTLRALVSYVRSHDFSLFGCYRILLAVIVAVYFTLSSRS